MLRSGAAALGSLRTAMSGVLCGRDGIALMELDWKKYFDAKGLLFGKYGAVGALLGALIAEIFYWDEPKASFFAVVIQIGVWAGIMGAGIAVLLMIAQDRYLKKEEYKKTWWKWILPGLLAGGASGGLAQAVYSFVGPTELLRVICWGILGGLLAAILSKRIPNLEMHKAAAGGLLGGAVGGMAFILVSYILFSVLGRFVGSGVIGFCIGLMIAVTETITREAWLEVHWSENETGTVSLGTKPILIGSGRECDIWVRDLPELLAKIWLQDGKIKMEDCTRNQMRELGSGFSLKFGGITATLHCS